MLLMRCSLLIGARGILGRNWMKWGESVQLAGTSTVFPMTTATTAQEVHRGIHHVIYLQWRYWHMDPKSIGSEVVPAVTGAVNLVWEEQHRPIHLEIRNTH
ncbi:hypothetical protein EDD22DRAFT_862998 [Suillus occidentalis]|nr:hypothetical protein EDD22DRAFT_862998 [Suillus occidentalis]